jgi:hypothetical protein
VPDLAHQRFVQNKGIVLLILTSLTANIIVSFLHTLVPSLTLLQRSTYSCSLSPGLPFFLAGRLLQL